MTSRTTIDRILELVKARPGLTEAEIARSLFGANAVQQNVNKECRMLVELGLVDRQGIGGRTDPYTYRVGNGVPLFHFRNYLKNNPV